MANRSSIKYRRGVNSIMSRKLFGKTYIILVLACLLIYLTVKLGFRALNLPSGKVAGLNSTNAEEGMKNITTTRPTVMNETMSTKLTMNATNIPKNTNNPKSTIKIRSLTTPNSIHKRKSFTSTKPPNNWTKSTIRTSRSQEMTIRTSIRTSISSHKLMTTKTSFAARPTRRFQEIYGEGCKIRDLQISRFPTLFEFWLRLAARRNITDYFICFGSLLGAWLHGGPVPYDHDIDICILRKDLPKLDPEEEKRPFNYKDGKPHLIIQRFAPHPKSNISRQDCHGNVVTTQTDPCAIVNPHARVVLGRLPFLDIFVLADHVLTLFDEFKGRTYRRDVILPLMPCTFLGIPTNCPNKVPEYLVRNYGRHFMKPFKVCRNGTWRRN